MQAMAPLNGLVYTVDLLQVPPQHPTRHKCIQKARGLRGRGPAAEAHAAVALWVGRLARLVDALSESAAGGRQRCRCRRLAACPQDVYNLTAADLDGRHVDLLFFDAHVAEPQMHL